MTLSPAPWFTHRIGWLTLLLGAYALRVIRLDRLGLAYDEAATALMSRADPASIVAFHWTAAFEHPPVWVLLMAGWTRLAGQSEFALRYLPALAGVLIVALLGVVARRAWPKPAALGLCAGLLAASAPVLVYYSQEARMYTLVVALALATLLPALRLRRVAHRPSLVAFWLLNWLMLGLHYYTALVPGILLLALAVDAALSRAEAKTWLRLFFMFAGALLPLSLWLIFAPSFHETVRVVLDAADEVGVTWHYFLSDLWREISFGNIRWLPPQARLGFLLAPLVIAGALLGLMPQRSPAPRWLRWYIVAAALLPILSAAIALRTLSPRYILYVVPLLYLLAALSITAAAVWRPSAGAVLLLALLAVNGAGLFHYFGPYRKSDYRAAAHQLIDQVDLDQDIIVLEGPRQHLLARYYLPSTYPFTTVPAMDLPAHWPVTGPLVVPDQEDDRVQAWLSTYHTLWVVFTGEVEVDAGEFLAKYLDAVSYLVNCDRLLDLRLCQYRSPRTVTPALTVTPGVLFGGELALESASLSLDPALDPATDAAETTLLLQMNWHAVAKPSIDYKVTVRLVPAVSHDVVLAQHDQFPIGTLLPPTTWAAGDRKPGYIALHLPPDLAPGRYALDVALYDAATLAPVSGTHEGTPTAPLLVLANVTVDDTISLGPVQ